MKEALIYLWYLFQVLVGYNLIMPLALYTGYLFCRKKNTKKTTGAGTADYAILVTAYRYADSLTGVVDSLLRLNYENFLIYIVADNCDVEDLSFHDEKIIVLRPEAVLASNTRSHFYAIERFKRKHDRLAIIDSDNIVDPEFLNELNVCFDQGYQAVQGLRRPRNLDTTLACLDAGRDIYYHFYDGKVLFEIGSSATLSGSGMAFTVSLYRDCMRDQIVDGAGFDKVLQAQIVKRGRRIAFAERAVVYDAKTSKAHELVNQRSRWIGTWFTYCKYSFPLILSGIRTFSVNQLLFGTILLRPPLFIFLVLSAALWFVNWFVDPVAVFVWTTAFFLFLMGFVAALIRSGTDKRIYKAFIFIPQFMFLQVLALSKFLLKRKAPVSTKHTL